MKEPCFENPMNIWELFGELGPKKSWFSGRLGLGVRFNYLKLASGRSRFPKEIQQIPLTTPLPGELPDD